MIINLGNVSPPGSVRLATAATDGCDTNNDDCRKVVVDTNEKRTITFDLDI